MPTLIFDYELTERGWEKLDSLKDFPGRSLLWDIGSYDRDENPKNRFIGKNELPTLNRYLSYGWVGLRSAEPTTFYEKQLFRLPTEGGLRRTMKTYIDLVHEREVPPEALEHLRGTLIEGLRGMAGEEYEELRRNLESATTRSEKVIAIDNAMRVQHGEGNVMQYGTGTTRGGMGSLYNRTEAALEDILQALAATP